VVVAAAVVVWALHSSGGGGGGAQTGEDFFGVDAVNMLRDAEEAPEFQLLGVKTVRVNLEWGAAEGPGASSCETTAPIDWAHYDEVFYRAAEHGLTILVDLYGNRAACGDGHWFPLPGSHNFADYATPPGDGSEGGFVAQAVRRYGDDGTFWSENPQLPYLPVRAWEVWNEPNLPENNADGEVDPQAYARLLIASAAAIRGADPEATVLSGGLYMGAGQPVDGYLASIYGDPDGYTASEFSEAFDGLAIHPYAATGRGAALTFGGPELVEKRTEEAREALDTARAALGGGSDSARPLWVTELGWPTEFAGTASTAAITPARQASDVVAAMSWLHEHAEGLDISFAALFSARDYHSEAGCTEAECWPMYAGMKRIEFAAGTPHYVDRPLRCAYKKLVSGHGCPGWEYEPVGPGGAAAIASRGVGSLELFTRGAGRRLYQRTWSMLAGWSGWLALPGEAVASAPAAVATGPLGMRVAARLPDKSVGLWTDEAGDWTERNLGGLTQGRPALAEGGESRTDVFARGESPNLYHLALEPGDAAPTWELMPGPLATSDPSAASLSPGTLDVVARTAATTIGHWHYAAGVWGFEEIPAPAGSAPAIVAPGPERLDVFFTGKEGIEHTVSEAASPWSEWEPIPGKAPGSAPTAVAWSPNRIDLAATVAGGRLGHWTDER
jgi:hypothetical protein